MNRTKNWFRILGAFFALIVTAGLNAQSTADTGALKGRVTDDKGAPLPGAVIKAKGPQGSKGAESDNSGNYNIPFLTPGTYEVTVAMDGFDTIVQSGVTIQPLSNSVQSFKLSSGGGNTVTVTASGLSIDTTSSTAATKINLSAAISDFARPNSLTSAFDFAPGVNAASGLGGGNVSISGSSGLENQYFIGGVNITNTGFGAIGAYDRVLGSVGTGVTTEFLDSIDIREGGFEAEYGGALGGVVSATIKSGTNDWHGGVTAYYAPRSLEGERKYLSRSGGIINSRGVNTLDVAVNFGGPIIKDKLFFFVAYNPTWVKGFNRFDVSAADLAMDEIVAPYANQEYDTATNKTDNYAAHLTWNITEKHKLDLILFGSPQTRNGILRGPGRRVDPNDNPGITVYDAITAPNGVQVVEPLAGVQADRKVKDFSYGVKYFGSFAPWMSVEAVVGYHRSQTSEKPTGASDSVLYTDGRRAQVYSAQKTRGMTPVVSPAAYQFGGLGQYQGGTNDENLETTLKFTNTFSVGSLGSMEIRYGGSYADIRYHENLVASGPQPTVRLDNAVQPPGTPNAGQFNPDSYVKVRTGVIATVRCNSVNPNGTDLQSACTSVGYRVTRGNFNPPTDDTKNKERNFFIQDKWSITPSLTINLGARYTQSTISGSTGFTPTSVTGNVLTGVGDVPFEPLVPSSYKFKGEWAPRLGLTWDVMGNGKSKLYAGFARIFQRMTQDLAVRSLSNEIGLTRVDYANPDLTSQVGRARTSSLNPTCIAGGQYAPTHACYNDKAPTRLPYQDDLTLGYQFEVAPRFVVDIKGTWRTQGRTLEDVSPTTIEAYLNYYDNYLIYYGACTNCAPTQTSFFPDFTGQPYPGYYLANVGENDGGGFGGKPKHKYKSLAATFTKERGEGEHFSMQATYRIAKVMGNYEGLYRNDNGQSDPNITSLWDFQKSPLTEGQHLNGPLNTDVPHALRVNVGYQDLFIKGLSTAVTFKWQSGTPRTPLLAHPAYQNNGEIPGTDPQYYLIDRNCLPIFLGGSGLCDGFIDQRILKSYTPVQRGFGGRNPDNATWDMKVNYRWNLGKSNLDFSVLVNNIFNDIQYTSFDDDVERNPAGGSSAGVENPFYGQPISVKGPRTIRLGAKWSF